MTVAVGGCRGQTRPTTTRPLPGTTSSGSQAATTPAGGRATIAFDARNLTGALTANITDGARVGSDAVTSELTPNETAAVLARLEPLPDLSAQHARAPTLRAPSAPPPRAGATRPIAFQITRGKPVGDAPPTRPRPAVSIPLSPPEISPRDEVTAETTIRIRFSEPMVAVAAVGTSDKPVATIVPAVPGTWRWIDTRVATFTATAPYLPRATAYTVTVPAGTRSLAGNTLGAPLEQTFQTRALVVTDTYPNGRLRPDSAVAIQFDQDFDPQQVVPFLRVMRGKRKLPFRVVTLAEAEQSWRANPSLGYTSSAKQHAALGKHHMFIAPTTAWPAGTSPQIALAKGAPSREGPRVPARESYTSFDVASAFTVTGLTCGDVYAPRMSGLRCPANGFARVEFSNAIDATSYRSSKIQLASAGELEDHEFDGSGVNLWVPTRVGSTQTVVISGDLVDIYAQPLVGARRPTFVVTRERFEPYVSAPSGLVMLDPRYEIPQWIVQGEVVGAFHVQMFAVKPADYFAFVAWERGERTAPPGKKVLDKFYPVGPRHGAILREDLRPALGAAGTGHVIAIVRAQPAVPHKEWTPTIAAWIEVTKLGTTARVDGEHLNAWVQDISPGKFLEAIPGAVTSIVVEGRDAIATGTSDATGHVAFDLPAAVQRAPKQRTPIALLAVQTATDTMFSTIYGSYERATRHQDARWYVTDDRFMYKPGEKVYVKGWVRWSHSGVNPDLAQPAPGDTVSYTLDDPRGNRIASGTTKLTDQGGFDLEVTLPENTNLGTSSFTFTTKTSSHRHPIAVQEFRTPAYAVSLNDDVTHAGATPLVLGEQLEMSATAKYYAGGGLPGADIEWSATLEPATYRPPGWDNFDFTPRAPSTADLREIRASSLTGASSSSIVYGIAALPGHRPSVLSVDATVADVDRMRIRASSRPILVHPSTYYVGLRLAPRTTNVVEAIVTDIEGAPVLGVAIDLALTGVLGSERGRDDAIVIDTHTCKLTSAATPVTCRFTRKDVMTAYTANAKVTDPRGRANSADLTLPWYAWDDSRPLSVTPDKSSYRPGDIAKLDIRTKQLPGTAVVSFARQGVISQQRVALVNASTIVELPIEPTYLQNIHVLVDRWADKNGSADDRAKAKAKPKGPQLRDAPFPTDWHVELDLPVDVESARLQMRTRPLAALVEPGAPATFEVEVRHEGKPKAGAEVALIVVDEAVLALTGKSHADPLEPFYRNVGHGTQRLSSLQHLRDDAGKLAGTPGFTRYRLESGGFGTGGAGAGMGALGAGRYGTIGHGGGSGIVAARKDFRATAVFSPRLHTDANGKVRLTVTMPDSLTRFRVIALATSDTRYFGKAENAIVTQRKVNARTVAPRFLSQGDRFSLPVVVQNLDTAPRTVDVGARAANLVAVGPAGKRITIPGGQRAEVRFEFTTRDRGKAVIQTIAISGDFADASNVELPVYEPATTESFATYGIVEDAPQFERLDVPSEIFSDVGGVEVELASTQLQSLTDAYWYLYAYPYECAEQRSSRMLATSAMYDILEAFETPGRPTKAEITETAAADVAKLAKDQRGDGGWGYFDGMKSEPFVTMQVLAALAAQKSTPPRVMQSAAKFVLGEWTRISGRLATAAAKPGIDRKDRDEHAYLVSLAAMSLTALAAAKVDVTARAERLHVLATQLGAYPVDAKARLLAIVAQLGRAKAMRDKLVGELVSATQETAAAATVTTRFGEAERALLVSDNKTTALVLDALIREVPQHALIAKLARGVLDARKQGRWASTQENLVVLQAMRRYFDTYEKDTPNYTGKLWFGAAAYVEQAFVGRTSARGVAQLPWTKLPAKSSHDVALQKLGPGRMYYRIGITYAPKRVDLPALDAGFVVRRSYTAIDDPSDVTKLADGKVKVRLGARVQITVDAINTTRRFAVALVDPLPAGFEAVNDQLATSERVAAQDTTHWDFRNMRDNRAEVFAMDLREGTHRFTYTARATTPGVFIAAPTKAEEMYTPETFGRSTGVTVIVE